MDCVDLVVIGAGAVGLSVARLAAGEGLDTFVLEQASRPGEGVSSRNSEVLHSGIYYPRGTLKSHMAIEGNRLLGSYLEEAGISASLNGKLIVAVEEDELDALMRLKRNADEVGVEARVLDPDQIRELEPHVQCVKALFVPSAGVFDTVAFIRRLAQDAEELGAFLAYGSRVDRAVREDPCWRILVQTDEGQEEIMARTVVNAAGLGANAIAEASGFHVPPLYPCKGRYFSLVQSKGNLISRPIYPVPGRYGLGIHLTPDVRGQVKLGPDTLYVDEIDYTVDDSVGDLFFESVKRFFPVLERDDIAPAMSGIRPKIQGPGDDFRDFYVRMDGPGFINLIGIESPGLTASPALAVHVMEMLRLLFG